MILGFLGTLLRQPDQGGRLAAARVPGRCLGRAVHAQSRRHRRRAQTDRLRHLRLTHRKPARRRGQPHVFRRTASPAASPDCSRPIRRSANASARSIPTGTESIRRRSPEDAVAGLARRRSFRPRRRRRRCATTSRCRSPSSATLPSRSAIPPKPIAQYAAELVAAMPQASRRRGPRSVRRPGVIFASLMDQNPQVRAAQLAALQQRPSRTFSS